MNHYYGIRTTPRTLIDSNIEEKSADLVELLTCNDIIYLDRRHGYEDLNFASFKKHMKIEYKFWSKDIVRMSYTRESRLKNKKPEEILKMFKEYLNIPVLLDETKLILDDEIIFSPIIIKTIDLYAHDTARGSIRVSSEMLELDVKVMKEIRSKFNLKNADLSHVVTIRHGE